MLTTMLCKVISIFFLVLLIRVEAHFQLDSTPKNDEKAKLNYRLPSHIVPKNYEITLKPYFEEPSDKKFTFHGDIEIALTIVEESPEIVLHARELKFDPSELTLKTGLKSIRTRVDFDGNKQDFVRISNNDTATTPRFAKGDYVLKIKNFKGILNDDMRGFYRSAYKNKKGETTWLATTHFEPVGARRAFPCFDEPGFKATFDLTIEHPVNYKAISNMPVKSSVNITGSLTKTIFDTTPSMSTYLLAFVVSDFEYLENENFKVYAKPSAVETGKLALESGQKLLKALEEYTSIKFTLPKMDQIAIPDFTAGAMENWGLVTYKERSLLYNEKTSTTSEKQNIVETIAHEFGHQWFGDLVSPKWWKFLWLNEGFANFLQSYITQQVDPKWQSIYQSVVKSIQTTAFDFDSSAKTHPINQDVESPEEISAIFDSISYQKGGAVIRMMQHFLGNDVFKRGLNIYLTENGEKAANSNDLFRALDKAVQENHLNLEDKLETIMDTWVNRKGYPVVTVTRNYNNSEELKIEQKRFFSYNATGENEKTQWFVPINYATTKNQGFDNTSVQLWLNESSKLVPLSINPDEWIILNKQQTGFYRVNYDEKNWQLITSYLNSDKRNDIHVLNRAQLVNDALAFVKEGSLKLEILLNLSSYLTNETDYIAWYPGFKSLSWLKEKFVNTDHYAFFKEYVLNTTQNFVESVGFEESSKDEYIEKYKRVLAVRWWCSQGNSTCLDNAKTKLEKWIAEPESNLISPDLKQVTLCEGLRTASLDLWNKAFEKCLKTVDDDEKSYLASALGCSNDRAALQHYLNHTMDQNTKLNDTFAVVRNIRDNSDVGVDTVLDFIIQQFKALQLKYQDEKRLSDLFNDVGAKITTETQLTKLRAAKDVGIPASITVNGLQAAEKNVAWLGQNEKTITAWKEEVLKRHSKNGVPMLNAHVGFILSMSFAIFKFMN